MACDARIQYECNGTMVQCDGVGSVGWPRFGGWDGMVVGDGMRCVVVIVVVVGQKRASQTRAEWRNCISICGSEALQRGTRHWPRSSVRQCSPILHTPHVQRRNKCGNALRGRFKSHSCIQASCYLFGGTGREWAGGATGTTRRIRALRFCGASRRVGEATGDSVVVDHWQW
jgi:hypothetical protein